ncbi:Hypothetical protein EIN_088110, partial [Entamoeba invadens IP1]|uniref:Hypothetical protein n=1 Tax=Entamoeba invadens IP1 TaxID=370355 RepID=UPI0002C3D38A
MSDKIVCLSFNYLKNIITKEEVEKSMQMFNPVFVECLPAKKFKMKGEPQFIITTTEEMIQKAVAELNGKEVDGVKIECVSSKNTPNKFYIKKMPKGKTE